jgi:hypothetical protein
MTKTKFIKGIGVTAGIIIGKAYLVDRRKIEAPARVLPEFQVPQEVARFLDAVEESRKQLRSAKEKLLHEEAAGLSYILDTHLLLLEDKKLIENTVETIKQSWINSEWALKINLDRVRTLDDTLGRFYAGELTLPANAREIPDYYAHLKATIRVLEDGPGGQRVARYIESGPDHLAHAENYCGVAAGAPASQLESQNLDDFGGYGGA